MTAPQILSFAVIALMMAAFVWGRFRYDLVAACALLLARGARGRARTTEAFSGFSDDIVIIVGSALLVSAGVARSGIMEAAIQRYAPDVRRRAGAAALLVVAVTVLSAFVKNIGALAIMIPIAFQFARRSAVSPSIFLMPMAFGSLIGGLMTQIGTSPNIVVSPGARGADRREPSGCSTSRRSARRWRSVGLVFLVALLLAGAGARARERLARRGARHPELHDRGRGRGELRRARQDGGRPSRARRRRGGRHLDPARQKQRITPFPDAVLKEGDIALIEGDHDALDRMVAQAKLSVTGSREAAGGPGARPRSRPSSAPTRA